MAAHDKPPLFNASAVQALLHTRVLGRTLHVLADVESTNTTALALADSGAPHGTVVAADTQTAGRGRMGRAWHSPSGENLYCSILLRNLPSPGLTATWLSWLPLISGIAVLRTIEAVSGLHPTLKWPNDVLIQDRKIAGVLCESSGLGSSRAVVVVGIGLNLNTECGNFPADLRESATSMRSEAGRTFDRIEVLGMLLNQLDARYEALADPCFIEIREEYGRLCSTLGRDICVTLSSHEAIRGVAEAITEDGALAVLEKQSGRTFVVRAGDVTHVR
jgi:BirA family biotin operon repressor/biotin-[acetyl-CoA-carboxylase] ligase